VIPRQGVLPLLEAQPGLWVDWDRVKWAVAFSEPDQSTEFDPFDVPRHSQRSLFGKFTSVPIIQEGVGAGSSAQAAEAPCPSGRIERLEARR